MSYKTNTILGGVSIDDRGSVRYVNDFDFSGVKRFYQVENHQKGFIRAWHGHEKEGKYVYVVKGSILLGVVDMVDENIEQYILSSTLPKILYIPPQKYNGFKTLEENTIVMFFSTSSIEESKGDDIRQDYDKWNIWDIKYR